MKACTSEKLQATGNFMEGLRGGMAAFGFGKQAQHKLMALGVALY